MPFLGNLILPDNFISTHVLCSNLVVTVPASYVPTYMVVCYLHSPGGYNISLAKLMLSGDMHTQVYFTSVMAIVIIMFEILLGSMVWSEFCPNIVQLCNIMLCRILSLLFYELNIQFLDCF